MSCLTLSGSRYHRERSDGRTWCGVGTTLTGLPIGVDCRSCLGARLPPSTGNSSAAKRGPFYRGSWLLALDPLSGV